MTHGPVTLHDALRGAGHGRPRSGAGRGALVVGAAGALGTAMLEQVLGGSAFQRVAALVDRPIAAGLRGFDSLTPAQLGTGDPARHDTAFVVFDRRRHANGREDAFHAPQPEALAPLAQALHRHGVRHLLVVMPHTAALLPQALRVGLASLDEQAVAALGFEQVVFLRTAAAPARPRDGGQRWLQRVADGVLSQLHWMVPQRQQPVQARHVAAFAVALARALPSARPGTRVAPPELVWLSAQPGSSETLAERWLADGLVPLGPTTTGRW